jgi:hypothetical protein
MEPGKNMKKRTLSDDYNSRSPNTQFYVRNMAQAVPTSKPSLDINANLEIYYASSPTTRNNMETYGLVILRPVQKNNN